MSAGEGFDFVVGFFWKAQAEIGEDHVAANPHEVKDEPSESAGKEAFLGPREFIDQPEQAEAQPSGPVLRQPKMGLLAAPAHAGRDGGALRYNCGLSAGSLYILNWK